MMSSRLHFHFAENLPKTRRALGFALLRHGGQHRSGDGAVLSCIRRKWRRCWLAWAIPDDVVAAAVLHDVLEDTDAEFADLRSRFGARVAELVAVVSDDPAIADEDERKAEVRDRVRTFGEDALAVYAADKVSKVRELRLLIVTGLPPARPRRSLIATARPWRCSSRSSEMPISSSCCDSRSRRWSNCRRDPRLANGRRRPPVTNHAEPVPRIEQRHAALALANEVRGQRAAVKRGISDGTVSMRALVQAPSMPADRCTVAELLRSQAGWGPARTLRFLTRHGVDEHKQLGQLTARQRSIMAADLA